MAAVDNYTARCNGQRAPLLCCIAYSFIRLPVLRAFCKSRRQQSWSRKTTVKYRTLIYDKSEHGARRFLPDTNDDSYFGVKLELIACIRNQ